MHSKGKRRVLCGPALCIVMLVLVATSSAAVLGALSGCKSAEAARLHPDSEKDAKITSAVQAKLASDGDISQFNLTVTTRDSVVTLEGRVSKADARDKAERLARETDGVQRVIDLVKVGDGR